MNSKILSTLLVAFALPTFAAPTQCPQHFFAGAAPDVVNPKLKPRTQELCRMAFAVLHSGISRTPIYSAEHLTSANIALADKLPRKDSFHAEHELPAEDRAELSDYLRSGYDKGHMAPNHDMPDFASQAESFTLANMVPQEHINNAGIWSTIESTARMLARDEGEVWVVSGPVFTGGKLTRIGNVLVPTSTWKAIYRPATRTAGVYITPNDQSKTFSTMSLTDLEKLAGVRPFPTLPQATRDAPANLPTPSKKRN